MDLNAYGVSETIGLATEDAPAPAGVLAHPAGTSPDRSRHHDPDLSNTELVQLRVRVIALENLVLALLVDGSERQIDLVRAMADYISPRPGFTPHHLTLQAAGQMVHMADRSRRFASRPPLAEPA